MNYDRIRKNPTQFLALAGLYVSEFDELASSFEGGWQKYHRKYNSRGKLRPFGSRSAPKERGPLARVEVKLFSILYYLKTHPLEEVLAASFDMDQPQANKWKQKLPPILQEVLQQEGFSPSRNTQDILLYTTRFASIRPCHPER